MTDVAGLPGGMKLGHPRGGWRARFRSWRNRIVADRTFQRRMARIPVFRQFAQSKANRLFALTAGFVYSQTLYACIDLGILETLRQGPRTTAGLAASCGTQAAPLARLLEAANALGLVTADSRGYWHLDDLGAVTAGDPGILAMIRHHAALYRDLADPAGLIRNRGRPTETGRFWNYAQACADSRANDPDVTAYSELMAASQANVATEVLDAHDFSIHQSILDIGGGHGAFLIALATRHPDVRLALYDLPPVVARARELLDQEDFAERTTFHSGSFFHDPVPPGADCVTLIRVLYDHPDEAALALLKRIHAAMRPGSTLVIGEPMALDSRAGALIGAYFSFYLLAMGEGRCRSPADIGDLLKRAGFTAIQQRATAQPLYASVVTAKRQA